MIQQIKNILVQPYPFEKSKVRILSELTGVSLFVSLFLIIFQPFGSDEIVREGKTWILWGYGFVTFFVLLFDMFILPVIFPFVFNEEKWDVLHELCYDFWHIISIGIGNSLYSYYMGPNELNVITVLGVILTTLSIGIFPISASVLVIQNRLLKKYAESTREINRKIKSPENVLSVEQSQVIEITSESEKEKLVLRPHNLLLIKSIDNYVEVYSNSENKIKTTLLRSSLKRIEENLGSYPVLFRCHRTYMVNVKNISNVTGNSQGYKLSFNSINFSVPVSRSYSKTLLKLLG